MKKIVFVLLDGLTRKSAEENLGYLRHLTETGNAYYRSVRGELPSMSRPCYESILTGTPAYVHGITNNMVVRRSVMESVFSLARKAGLRTGAAAYHWISELYNASPFNMLTDRITHDEEKNIQHGIFYFDESYPSSHLFVDAEYLRSRYSLDFLLVHPMGPDYTGHAYGSGSKEYESKSIEMDVILSNLIPLWVGEGYGVIVTADHGMSEFGNHGGDRAVMRNVFAYFVNVGKLKENKEFSQLSLAPTVCGLLGIESAAAMKEKPIILE